MRPNIGLLGDTRKRQDTILCIGFGTKHPFWRVISFRNLSMEFCSRPIIPRHKICDEPTNYTKGLPICYVWYSQLCISISDRGQITSFIYQLQRSQNHDINYKWNGPPLTTNISTLWQHGGNSDCQQYRQVTTLPINGNNFFWGHKSGQKWRIWRTMASRSRNPKDTTKHVHFQQLPRHYDKQECRSDIQIDLHVADHRTNG